jgi:hypothetical protein
MSRVNKPISNITSRSIDQIDGPVAVDVEATSTLDHPEYALLRRHQYL